LIEIVVCCVFRLGEGSGGFMMELSCALIVFFPSMTTRRKNESTDFDFVTIHHLAGRMYGRSWDGAV
jgi:hypothetical protein